MKIRRHRDGLFRIARRSARNVFALFSQNNLRRISHTVRSSVGLGGTAISTGSALREEEVGEGEGKRPREEAGQSQFRPISRLFRHIRLVSPGLYKASLFG